MASKSPQMHDRKRRRMESNRESARRSRMRKQQHLDDLIKQEAHLKSENAQISMQIGVAAERWRETESENAVLRARMTELSDKLRSANSVLRVVEDFSGMAMDIAEQLPDPLLKPWQLSCAAQPIITASAEMFHC